MRVLWDIPNNIICHITIHIISYSIAVTHVRCLCLGIFVFLEMKTTQTKVKVQICMGQAVAATMHINLFISWKRGSGGRERGVYWPHVKQFKKAINTQKKKKERKNG